MSKSVIRLIAASAVVFNLTALPVFAETKTPQQHNMQNHDQMNHSQMNTGTKTMAGMGEVLPKEPGQGAFATIAEIVVMLTSDPSTDWSKVDIDALREHLIDMDEVSLRAASKTTVFKGKIVFTVTGEGRTKQAIQAMVPAHAAVLSRTTAWDVKGEITGQGAIMTVSSNKSYILDVVKALGFYGVMATGAHHQAHHLAMAKGDNNAHAHN
jgi:hypothetical protein